MSRRAPRAGAVLVAVLVLVARPAHAYIDPGTTSSLFAVLAPLLAVVLGFLGYLLWPFRKALGRLLGRGGEEEAAAEGEEAAPPPSEEKAGSE